MLDTIRNVTSASMNNAVEQPSRSSEVVSARSQAAQKNVAERRQPSEEQVKSAVEDLNNALQNLNVKRQFEVDKEVDSEQKEVIRQIPSEEAIKLSKNIKEMLGLLFDSKS
jgi:flagellar protein FlaG